MLGDSRVDAVKANAIDDSLWARFVGINKRICKEFLQPRLYAVTHMSAAEWWFLTHTSSLGVRQRLLEFGCSRTFPVSKLCGPYFERCDATDIEDIPKEYCPSNVVFTQCQEVGLPYESGCFDAVVIRSVIEHVKDPSQVFREIARVLKPGGQVYMNLPNKWDYVSVAARLTGQLKSRVLKGVVRPGSDDFPVFYRANTRRALQKALVGSGLSIETFRPLPSEPAYLRFFIPFYIIGALYQFAVSLFVLDVLQPGYLVMLRKGL